MVTQLEAAASPKGCQRLTVKLDCIIDPTGVPGTEDRNQLTRRGKKDMIGKAHDAAKYDAKKNK